LAVYYQESGEVESAPILTFRSCLVKERRVLVRPRELNIVPREVGRVELDELDLLDFLPVSMDDFS